MELDWTEAAAKAGRHPIKVAYPTSTEMAKAGFSDSYRKIYPDEMKNPGITNSTVQFAPEPEKFMKAPLVTLIRDWLKSVTSHSMPYFLKVRSA